MGARFSVDRWMHARIMVGSECVCVKTVCTNNINNKPQAKVLEVK